MSAAAAAMILGVVLIVLALVYFLVSTIFQLRKIVAGLDRVIEHVGGIVEKSAPVMISNCALIASTAGPSGARCSASTPSSAPDRVARPEEIESSRRRISISASARTATTTTARMIASRTWPLISRRTRP